MGQINRYSRQDLNSILYKALQSIRTRITGGIYIDNERPNDPKAEDIVINTPSLTLGRAGEMQKGYSNINIYVPTKQIAGPGGARSVYNPRLETIKNMVIERLQTISIEGYLDITSENEGEADTFEQMVNIRLTWKIYKL